MMKKTYESPDFECLKYSFEATLQNIQYSKNEPFIQDGEEGDDAVAGG